MTKPITIPRDLRPGDIGVCRDGTRSVYNGKSGFKEWPFRFDHPRDGHYTVSKYGLQTGKDNPQPRDIIRIERIASAKPKKAKGDRDAKWLIREYVDPLESNAAYRGPRAKEYIRQAKRLRAIARRLEGGR